MADYTYDQNGQNIILDYDEIVDDEESYSQVFSGQISNDQAFVHRVFHSNPSWEANNELSTILVDQRHCPAEGAWGSLNPSVGLVAAGWTPEAPSPSSPTTGINAIGFNVSSTSMLVPGTCDAHNYQEPSPATPQGRGTPHLYRCDRCSTGFKEKKDLVRHNRTIHRTDGDLYYWCRCGKNDPRKDNHLNHLRRISPCQGHSYNTCYICKCFFTCTDKQEHIDHVRTCRNSFGRIGRPRQR
ncbi:hypothetical protein F4803DRAFT_507748 [Xylaria telfairii]|nr:hypothetical protein F4803DRAFT_507748 [Xylaria telfairii]